MRLLSAFFWLASLAGCAATLPPGTTVVASVPTEPFRVFPSDGAPTGRAAVDLSCVEPVQLTYQGEGRYLATCDGKLASYECELVAVGKEQCRRTQ
jgi:hypothetical protein